MKRLGSNFNGLKRMQVIKSCFSTGNIQGLILFFSIAIVCLVFFRNKENLLNDLANDDKKRGNFFKESMFLLIGPIAFAIILNLFFKSIIFVITKDTLSALKITYLDSIISYVYIFAAVLISVGIHYIFQIAIKSQLWATMLPAILIESLIMVFGVASLFVSESIWILKVISDAVSEFVFEYVNLFITKSRVEIMDSKSKMILLAIMTVVATMMILWAKNLTYELNKESLKYNFRFMSIRRIVSFLVVCTSIIFSVSGVLILISVFNSDLLGFEMALILSNVICAFSIPIVFVLVERRYLKNNNLISKKENKKTKNSKLKKSKISAEKKSDKEVNVKVNENDLDSKGIIKETVKVKCKEVDDDDNFFIMKNTDNNIKE